MLTKGYAATSADSPLTPFTFERRPPGDRDVQIAIEFCGICHSDIHSARNQWQGTEYPFVPGHEITSDIELVRPDQIRAAFERTVRGDVKYRFVIDCTRF